MNKILFLGIFACLLNLLFALSCYHCPAEIQCAEVTCNENQRKKKPTCGCCYECQDIIQFGGKCSSLDYFLLFDNRCADGLHCISGTCQLFGFYPQTHARLKLFELEKHLDFIGLKSIKNIERKPLSSIKHFSATPLKSVTMHPLNALNFEPTEVTIQFNAEPLRPINMLNVKYNNSVILNPLIDDELNATKLVNPEPKKHETISSLHPISLFFVGNKKNSECNETKILVSSTESIRRVQTDNSLPIISTSIKPDTIGVTETENLNSKN